MINLLLVNHFYPVMYRRKFEKKAANYCIYSFGHSLWSAISCQRKRSTAVHSGIESVPLFISLQIRRMREEAPLPTGQ